MKSGHRSEVVLSKSRDVRRAPVASTRRTPSWLYVLPALMCFCPPVPAGAAEAAAPEWKRVCEALPDTNCITVIELGDENGGPVDPNRGALAAIVIAEPTRDAPAKTLRAVINFQVAPTSQQGTIQITVDSKPFADVPFVRCMDKTCFGEKQISAAEVATLEGAKSFEIQSQTVKVSSPIRNLAAARASTAKTFAEVNAERERLQKELQEKLKQRAKEATERMQRGGRDFLADAPAARPQDGFCDALKRVMAAASDDFKSIRGEKEYSFSPARISVPGSGKCLIDNYSIFGYNCTTSFKLREVADRQMAGLAQSVGKCLPNVKAERSKGDDGLPAIEFDNKQSTIGIRLQNMDKSGGGYDVMLSVDRVR